jgi:hypothetical protein
MYIQLNQLRPLSCAAAQLRGVRSFWVTQLTPHETPGSLSGVSGRLRPRDSRPPLPKHADHDFRSVTHESLESKFESKPAETRPRNSELASESVYGKESCCV